MVAGAGVASPVMLPFTLNVPLPVFETAPPIMTNRTDGVAEKPFRFSKPEPATKPGR